MEKNIDITIKTDPKFLIITKTTKTWLVYILNTCKGTIEGFSRITRNQK